MRAWFPVWCARLRMPLHAYGQTYAIDLVREPADGSRPQFGAGLPFQLASFEVDGAIQAGVPANSRPFVASSPRDAAEDRS